MMEQQRPECFDATARAVDRVIELTGGDIRLGMPLGLGKPNRFVNLLYNRARNDAAIRLDIYTALSLGRPAASSDLEKRFLEPFVDRVFGDYEELDYLADLRRERLPENVRVFEFFFQPASMLGNAQAQQHYISSNYTHVARDLNARGVNVVAQTVARDNASPDRLSLSCNPEVSLELIPLLEARRQRGETIVAVAQAHPELPWMGNDAEVDAGLFDVLIDDESAATALFCTPNMPVGLQDHMVGLHASTLVRDGGLLQIGIGALGDALVHHALMRHRDNQRYRDLLEQASCTKVFRREIDRLGGDAEFGEGLYGCSEMFTHGLMALIDGGVIRRRVHDDPLLQALLERGRIGRVAGLSTLDVLREEGAISDVLDASTLEWLCRWGLMPRGTQLDGDLLRMGDEALANDLGDAQTRKRIATRTAGASLQGGTLMHGGFFLGPADFYRRLRELDPELRAAINMTRIGFINHLYGQERLKRLQRRDARFMNTVFSATLLGAAVSDQLEDGRVLSGVGGQYNFVSQAHELEGARSVLMLRAWRERGGEAASNLVWSYGHTTIPRHLRDVFVTEYGIADLRGCTDAEAVAAMVNIADSRFQEQLLEQAKDSGKIARDYRVPETFRYNLPERLETLRQRNVRAFPSFPLGCDFTEVEQDLISALGWLKERAGRREYLELGRRAFSAGREERYAAHLERMDLARPRGLRERVQRRLVVAALDQAEQR